MSDLVRDKAGNMREPLKTYSLQRNAVFNKRKT